MYKAPSAHAGSLSVGTSYLRQAAGYLGNSGGAAVLRRYRCSSSLILLIRHKTCQRRMHFYMLFAAASAPSLIQRAKRQIAPQYFEVQDMPAQNSVYMYNCRFTPSDGELYKDIEGVLEGYCKTLQVLLSKSENLCSSGADDGLRGTHCVTLVAEH